MSEQEHQDKPQQIRYEDGVPILDFRHQLSEVERKQDAAESRNSQYQSDQIKLNRWLVGATVALVVSTVAFGGIQGFYMHRQWKLTSDGLSKAGDQIWAAKDAAFASKDALGENKRQFSETLAQIQQQTAAQQVAANASKSTAVIADKTLHISERAYLSDGPPVIDTAKNSVTIPIVNSGHIPSGTVEVTVHEETWNATSLSQVYPFKGTLRGDAVEYHWSVIRYPPIAPGLPYTAVVPVPNVDSEKLNAGRQKITIAGDISYGDGFADIPKQHRAFCVTSILSGNHQTGIPD